MTRLSKRMKEVAKLTQGYLNPVSLKDAINALSKSPKVKFDETVELHFHLSIDLKNSDQAVRGTVALPHGTGRKIRIAVVCK